MAPPVPARKPHVRSGLKFRNPLEFEFELYPAALGAGIPKDHPVRALAKRIEKLDLSKLLEVYDKKGGIPYHPAHMLAVVIFGISQGIRGERDLQECCLFDIRYRYLAGGHTPDDRSFGRFLIRVAPYLDELLAETRKAARKEGMGRGNEAAVDGTKMEAACSQRQGKVSELEPEAQTMAASRGFVLGYNAQAMVDTTDGFVLAAEVINDANDFEAAPKVLQAMRKQGKDLPARIVADSNYDSPSTICALEEAGVDTCIRLHSELPEYAGENADGVLVCRAGRPLEKCFSSSKGEGKGIYDYYGLKNCKGCPLFEACDMKRKRLGVPEGEDIAARFRNRDRLKHCDGAMARRRRIEKTFGSMKEHDRLRRFRRRGLAKARAEFVLWACTYNLFKLIRKAAERKRHESCFLAILKTVFGVLTELISGLFQPKVRVAA